MTTVKTASQSTPLADVAFHRTCTRCRRLTTGLFQAREDRLWTFRLL